MKKILLTSLGSIAMIGAGISAIPFGTADNQALTQGIQIGEDTIRTTIMTGLAQPMLSNTGWSLIASIGKMDFNGKGFANPGDQDMTNITVTSITNGDIRYMVQTQAEGYLGTVDAQGKFTASKQDKFQGNGATFYNHSHADFTDHNLIFPVHFNYLTGSFWFGDSPMGMYTFTFAAKGILPLPFNQGLLDEQWDHFTRTDVFSNLVQTALKDKIYFTEGNGANSPTAYVDKNNVKRYELKEATAFGLHAFIRLNTTHYLCNYETDWKAPVAGLGIDLPVIFDSTTGTASFISNFNN